MHEKIPTIVPDRYLTHVINKEKIIKFLSTESNKDKIEQYIKRNELILKNNPRCRIDDVYEILSYSNYRLNKLNGLDKISEVFEETKKEVNNLSNIEVIYTPANINDKNNEGFRHDVTYIKIKDELYEVREVEKVISFIGNKEFIKSLSEYEIIKFIKEKSDLIKTNILEDKQKELTTEEVEEEIKKESDKHIVDSLMHHKDDVVKERQKLKEYINKNMPSAIIHYGVNSCEERIYFVNDKIIKFEGKDRELQILTSLEVEKMKNGNFENKQGYNHDLNKDEYKKLEDFELKKDLLESLVEKLYNENNLTEEELDFLINFLELWIEKAENGLEIREELNVIVDKWFENSSIDHNFPVSKMSDVYERIRMYRKNKVKTYEPDLGNAAFISTFAILEASLVIGLIVALIALFK